MVHVIPAVLTRLPECVRLIAQQHGASPFDQSWVQITQQEEFAGPCKSFAWVGKVLHEFAGLYA